MYIAQLFILLKTKQNEDKNHIFILFPCGGGGNFYHLASLPFLL